MLRKTRQLAGFLFSVLPGLRFLVMPFWRPRSLQSSCVRQDGVPARLFCCGRAVGKAYEEDAARPMSRGTTELDEVRDDDMAGNRRGRFHRGQLRASCRCRWHPGGQSRCTDLRRQPGHAFLAGRQCQPCLRKGRHRRFETRCVPVGGTSAGSRSELCRREPRGSFDRRTRRLHPDQRGRHPGPAGSRA